MLRLSLLAFALVSGCTSPDAPGLGQVSFALSEPDADDDRVLAEAGFTFDEPAVRRCPMIDASAVLAPDGSALSVLFGGYELTVPEGELLARAGCVIDIPIRVPHGYTVSVLGADYRGYSFVPERGTVLFSRRYALGRQRARPLLDVVRGPADQNLEVDDDLTVHTLVGKCGADTTLRLDARLVALKPRAAEELYVSLDSVDIGSEVDFQLAWRECTE